MHVGSGVLSSTRLCGHHLPLWRDWGTLAGQEWPRQVPLRADSPSPSSSLPAKNSLSHYHASDTEHHSCEHTPGTPSCAEGREPGTQACALTNWTDTWLDWGVCANVGDTVVSWGGHGGTTQIQRAPGKPSLHLTLRDPHMSLPQSPLCPQWPQRKEGGRPYGLPETWVAS